MCCRVDSFCLRQGCLTVVATQTSRQYYCNERKNECVFHMYDVFPYNIIYYKKVKFLLHIRFAILIP